MHSLPHSRPFSGLKDSEGKKLLPSANVDVVKAVRRLACLGGLFGRHRDRDGRATRGCNQLQRSSSSLSIVSMSSMDSPSGKACLRAGWIYHQKAMIGKRWQQKWVSISADGKLTVANHKTSKRRGRHVYNLRQDCVYMWTGGQCRHLLPPPDVASANLIELLLTGERRLSFCGLSLQDSEIWCKSIETARSEPGMPSPAPPLSFNALHELPEEGRFCCFVYLKPSSKVKAIDYRPSTKQSSTSSYRKKRRVSWSKHVTLIGE